MTQLILKNDIQPHQLSGLLQLLRSRGIEAEVLPAATSEADEATADNPLKASDWFKRMGLHDDFDDNLDPIDPNDPLAGIRGMWKDYNINARDLRRGILPDDAHSTNNAKPSPVQRNAAYHIEEPVPAVADPSVPYSSTTKTQNKEDA